MGSRILRVLGILALFHQSRVCIRGTSYEATSDFTRQFRHRFHLFERKVRDSDTGPLLVVSVATKCTEMELTVQFSATQT